VGVRDPVKRTSPSPEPSHVDRLEAELRQAQKMEAVGRLAGGMAHDLNNVLTIIQSFGELVLDDLDAASPSHDYMKEILGAAQRARVLTRQLLAFSRRQTVDPRVVTLNEIAASTEKMLRRIIGEDIEVALRFAPRPWPVRVDPGHFEQVLINLAVNARDAMPRGGTLTIETANVDLDETYAAAHGVRLESGEYAMISVSDTGIGIPIELRERIFEPFFTTKDKSKGTGLGLSTCYGIVKQAGGFIWVYSEESIGSTFKIYLPRTREARRPTTGVHAAVDHLEGHETIMLVEDDDSVRALLVHQLRNYGYNVLPARNGLEALETATKGGGEIDLLVSDVVMPKMGGRQLADTMRARWPDLKVLFMSGYTDDALSRHGILEPGVVLLEKPFTPKRLAARIREVLAGLV
jgi:nitrogen-specific signal transduction histidine kinase/CheY-like chemotaxis protein